MAQPGYGPPNDPQQPYGQPTSGPPQYGQSQYGQPQYGQPTSSGPQYGYDPQQYGQQGGQPYGGQPAQVPNNLGWSIAGLLLFWPVGLFALLKALKVNDLATRGDVAGAQDAAGQAKKLGKIAVIVGGVLIGLSLLLVCGSVILALAGGAAATDSGY